MESVKGKRAKGKTDVKTLRMSGYKKRYYAVDTLKGIKIVKKVSNIGEFVFLTFCKLKEMQGI